MISHSRTYSLRVLLCLSLLVTLSPRVQPDRDFVEWRFRQSVSKALESVKAILDTARSPRLAEHEDHVYGDKYALVDFLSNTYIEANGIVLESLGLSDDQFSMASEWVQQDQRSAILRFEAERSCHFVEEKEVQVVTEETEVEVTETGGSSLYGGRDKKKNAKTKVSKTSKEFHWKVDWNIKLTIRKGNDESATMELFNRASSTTVFVSGGIKQSVESSRPLPEQALSPPIDLNLTWLLQNQFSIDRFPKDQSCRTPRRNNDVEKAFAFSHSLARWTQEVRAYFYLEVESVFARDQTQQLKAPLGQTVTQFAESIFRPILPLMENATVLGKTDAGAFLHEHQRTIEAAVKQLSKVYPPHETEDTPISLAEASIFLACAHLEKLALQYMDSVNYIENMLEKQLVQTIGKEVTADKFDEFMRFHNQKFFGTFFQPQVFSYAVRRPEHYPQGIISVDKVGWDDSVEPVETFVRSVTNTNETRQAKIYIPINAATSLEISGPRYLHGWMFHHFQSSTTAPDQFRLSARANQFSNFLLVVGTMAGPDKFVPKNALILQNKDEVLIPLITEVLPSAKQFKDAIASLSPEQQSFAKSFRAMQLESSSVFGVCVIQLKPQLEKLLGLPEDALTKEIKLTQALMSLFIEYQIPSDLLSFDGDDGSAIEEKVTSVKKHVKAVLDVIDQAKDDQLEEEKRKAEMHKAKLLKESKVNQRTTSSSSPSASPSSEYFHDHHSGELQQDLSRSSFTRPGDGATVMRSAQPEARAGRRLMHETIERSVHGEGAASINDEATFSSMDAGQEDDGPNKNARGDFSKTADASLEPSTEDFTLIPKALDARLEKYDTDGSLRPAILKAANTWERTRQENLLTQSRQHIIGAELIESEKKKAFDLLDAISRSGALPIANAELHVVIAVSHCFEHDIMTTIIEDNINPIEKVEKSALLLASTIHGEELQKLIGNAKEVNRVQGSFPTLFDSSDVQ